jgi:hydrogenase nickel incorporation protein HypB
MSIEIVKITQNVLASNDEVAARNRRRFLDAGVLAVNLIASPGAGKTSLIVKTMDTLNRPVGAQHQRAIAVIEGDIAGSIDAERVAQAGAAAAVQINTGGSCHLEAHMVERALDGLNLEGIDILFIENVGNLVCPSSYDLGEAAKIVVLSVTEGEDKPLKYPSIFFKSELLILNKTDLLPYVPFDPDLCEENARKVHPNMESLRVSCLSGAGFPVWLRWLEERRKSYLQSKQELAGQV